MAQKGSGSTPHGRSGDGFDDDGRPPSTPGSRREAPEVYRRRRLVAALAAGLLLVLVGVGVITAVVSVLSPGESAAVPAPDAATASAAAEQDPFADFTARPDEDASASASPSASGTAEPAEECGSALVVRASTDKETYAEGEQPVLVLTLENTGEDPCHVNAGTSQMVYEVGSGADTLFDSRHCQAGSEDRELTLEPGQEETARLTWDRKRTAEGCTEAGAEAQPGYYRLAVSLGERTGEPATFVLE